MAHALALAASGTACSNSNSNSTNTAFRNNDTFLTYQNPEFGIKIQYPSNWIKPDKGVLHSIAAFSLIHQGPFTRSNTTSAEVVSVDQKRNDELAILAEFFNSIVLDLKGCNHFFCHG
jgi:hypothetical protein